MTEPRERGDFQLRPGPTMSVMSGWMRMTVAYPLLELADRAAVHAVRLGNEARPTAPLGGKASARTPARPASRRACRARCVGQIFRDATSSRSSSVADLSSAPRERHDAGVWRRAPGRAASTVSSYCNDMRGIGGTG